MDRFYIFYISPTKPLVVGDRLYSTDAGVTFARVAGAGGQATQERGPTSDESVSGDWTGSPGSRFAVVDDYPDTAGADYLEHGTVAGDLCFGFSPFAVPAGATIKCVQVWAFTSEPVAGANSWAARLKVGGSYYNSSNTQFPATGAYLRQVSRFALNPKTGVAWTADDVNGSGANAIEAFGVRSADANPLFRISSVQVQVVYEVAYAGTDYIDVDVDPGREGTYDAPTIGDVLFDNQTTLIECIVVPSDETQQYYIYPSPSGYVYHAITWPDEAYPVEVGDFILNENPYAAKDVVTEVGSNWFKSVAADGFDKMGFAAGMDVWVNRGTSWTLIRIYPWLPTLAPGRILKYSVRIMSLTGELFDVAGYDLPHRRNVKMKLLLRELVEDAEP